MVGPSSQQPERLPAPGKPNVPVGLVERIYAHEELSEEKVQIINPELSLADLDDDIDEIGYPKGDSGAEARRRT
jgi:hypothetical protein